MLTPCPASDTPATVELAELVHGWVNSPPHHRPTWTAGSTAFSTTLAALETRWLPAAEGKTLLHSDINRSNLLVDSAGAIVLIDWAQPVYGAAWIDIADLVPQLMLGGTPPPPRRWPTCPPGATTTLP